MELTHDPTKYINNYTLFEQVDIRYYRCIPCNRLYSAEGKGNHTKTKFHHDSTELFLKNLINEFTPEI